MNEPCLGLHLPAQLKELTGGEEAVGTESSQGGGPGEKKGVMVEQGGEVGSHGGAAPPPSQPQALRTVRRGQAGW